MVKRGVEHVVKKKEKETMYKKLYEKLIIIFNF